MALVIELPCEHSSSQVKYLNSSQFRATYGKHVAIHRGYCSNNPGVPRCKIFLVYPFSNFFWFCYWFCSMNYQNVSAFSCGVVILLNFQSNKTSHRKKYRMNASKVNVILHCTRLKKD